jgi:hypothetical protein
MPNDYTRPWWSSIDESWVGTSPAVPTSSCACGEPTCNRNVKVIRTPHGRYTRYLHHNCRCDLCVAAYEEFRASCRVPKPEVCGCGNPRCTRRTRRAVQHGLSCYYRHKCRCTICVTAVRDYQRAYRAQRRAESNPAPAPLTLMEVFAEMDSLIHVFIG